MDDSPSVDTNPVTEPDPVTPDPSLVDGAARALAGHRKQCPGGLACETCRELAAAFRRAVAGRTVQITTDPATR